MNSKTLAFALAGVLGSLSVPACDLDVPDLNNAGLDDLENNPTASGINSSCTGLVIGSRRNVAAANGYVDVLGILGREALNIDNADPRYNSELLAGVLSRASPFGGNFWAQPYANIRLGHIIVRGVDKVAEFSAEEKSAIKGFTHTIQALDFLEIINAHDTNGAVIDTDRPIDAELAPIMDKPAVLAEIARLLDAAQAELAAGGDAFTFKLSSGFSAASGPAEGDPTFDTPPGFLRFNRAIRARVAAYMGDYNTVLTALTASFLNDNPATLDFDLGVYHAYSTGQGDATNGLINPNIRVNKPMQTEAQLNGQAIDSRFSRKVGLDADMNLIFSGLYPGPSAPVPIIRNEELILLKAEALFFKTPSDPAAAMVSLNLVREGSGGLQALAGTPSAATFTDQLLYERRYSLMFEGGHRWIDLRRFGRPLPLDKPTDVRNVRFPIPIAECDARPGEPKCQLGSTDG